MPERGMCHPDGRVCVEMFLPPHATAQFTTWSRSTGENFGPLLNWVVEYGRDQEGIDYIAVWVPEEQIPVSAVKQAAVAKREVVVAPPGRAVAA